MTTPENITELKPNQIFVFGSNLNGNHAGGSARLAQEKFGAEEGVGEGLTGQCYAFPTLDTNMKKVTKKALEASRDLLYKIAEENKDKQFLLTKVGCGIAGFTEDDMKAIFKGDKPSNVVMPAGWNIVRGYKAFEKGLVCRGFQYEFGKDFYHNGEIRMCGAGFHFCKSLGNVYNYYTFGTDIVVCEVESEGVVIDEEDAEKSVTNHIRLVRILNPEEASNNNGLNNSGHSNTGHRNTGHSNTGDRNTGDWNTGDLNTGHRNTGHRNTGDWNTGDLNTGHWNTGDLNTGHSNTGHRNTGHSNTGHSNTGDWNTGSFHVGSFNTKDIEEILVFNKLCKKLDWDKAIKPSCLFFDTKQWIDYSNMTDDEKTTCPSAKTAGGYIKDIPYKEAFTKSMQNASEKEIEQVKALPNFDADVFEEISGFRIN